MTLAASALTTLATVLDELGLTPDAGKQDARLERYITAVSSRVESYCNRSFFKETAKAEQVGGFGSFYLTVSKRPLLAITSITFDGSTINSDDYEIDGDGSAGLIRGDGGFVWTAGQIQNITTTPIPGSEKKLFTVTYDGGYQTPTQGAPITLPGDLEDAVVEMVTARWLGKARDRTVKSEKILKWGATYADNTDADSGGIPASIVQVLKQYREIAQA